MKGVDRRTRLPIKVVELGWMLQLHDGVHLLAAQGTAFASALPALPLPRELRDGADYRACDNDRRNDSSGPDIDISSF